MNQNQQLQCLVICRDGRSAKIPIVIDVFDALNDPSVTYIVN